jgi:uncharacterized RDD family membrane protein YckC
MEESDDRERSDGLTPGDPLGADAPPPPEPEPLPEEPLGPPSMYDDPPPAEPLPPPPPPPQGYPPPQAPPVQPPPHAYPPPQAPPPQQAPPAYAPPQGQPPVYPPPYGQPPPYAPPQGHPPVYQPPPYVPPPPRPRGPHGQPVWDNGVELATWGSRVGAYLLDFIFALAIPLAIGIPLAASGVNGLDVVGGIIILLAVFVGFPVYSAIVESRSGEHNGQTFGKQIVGIRVVRDNTESMALGFSMLRELVVRWLLIGFLGGLFFFPPLLDLFWPLWDETNRALHDMIVSTHVVRADPVNPTTPSGLPA